MKQADFNKRISDLSMELHSAQFEPPIRHSNEALADLLYLALTNTAQAYRWIEVVRRRADRRRVTMED